MRDRLRQLLVCPQCSGSLTLHSLAASGDDVTDGILSCTCGQHYPIVRGVPRVYAGCWTDHAEWAETFADARRKLGVEIPPDPRVRDKKKRTQESFGYQWTAFSEMTPEFEENFRNYVAPLTPEFFPGKLGLDAGCGFGRHIYYASKFGAEMVGLDYSDAIESTRLNTAHLPGVHLVQADIYKLPFRPGTFDFVYSLGVLHHLPDPFAAYQSLQAAIKPGGYFAVWLYSKTRKTMNAALEVVRKVTPQLPYPLLKGLSYAAAAVDWAGFIYPYRVLARTPLKPFVEKYAFSRVKVYAAYPFQVTYADWFDRLSPPIRFYYNEEDLKGWAARAALRDVLITPTGKYGWRLQGRVGG